MALGTSTSPWVQRYTASRIGGLIWHTSSD
jgi:hypothetical protein